MLITEKILANRQLFTNKPLFIVLDSNGQQSNAISYSDFIDQTLALAAWLNEQGYEKAILSYGPGLDFIISFYACLFAGVIAVPLPEITEGKLAEDLQKLNAISADIDTCAVLTDHQIHQLLLPQAGLHTNISHIIDTTALSVRAPQQALPPLKQDDIACLLYTSGSTGAPKGVIIRHKDFYYNAVSLADATAFSATSVGVSWMPQYHSFALVFNALLPVYAAGTMILLAPYAFVAQPYRWIQAISEYRATHSAAPTFGYLQAARNCTDEQLENIDLSSWQVGLIAAEPIKSFVFDTFFKRFASNGLETEFMKPLYGLSETGPISCVNYQQAPFFKSENTRAQSLSNACLGSAFPDTTIVCVNPDTRKICADLEVGEIWVSGPSVSSGYWRNDEINAQVFHQSLARIPGEFFRTGDLGYIWNNELYITGRLKEILIINGKNHAPQEIEWAVQQVSPLLASNATAAFSVATREGEKIIVAQEIATDIADTPSNIDTIYRAILQAAYRVHNIQLASVVFVPVGAIPRTAGGKIRRSYCKELFEQQQLPILALRTKDDAVVVNIAASQPLQPSGNPLEDQLYALFLKKLSLDLLPHDLELDAINLDSLQVAELAASIESTFKISFPPTLLFKYKNFHAIYNYIEARI